MPGVMHGTSGSQDAKIAHVGLALLIIVLISELYPPYELIQCPSTYRYIALTRIPTILPKVAPTAIEGTKMPAGTLAPYEMMIRMIRRTVARRSELTIRHCAQVLVDNRTFQLSLGPR